MTIFDLNGDVFETDCDLVDVTSMHRPDTSWRHVDTYGHTHRWFRDGQPADAYAPQGQYEVPTIRWVFESYGFYEDGTQYEIGHHECRQCGDRLEPRYTADSECQYVPGLRRYRINGEPVTAETFTARLKAAGL
jgi:hypothetical protein